MSNTQIAFLQRRDVPDRQALQASVERLGFPLTLDPDFTPFDDSGFSPCILDGVPNVGFEVFYEPAAALLADNPGLRAMADGRDYCISMVWRGSMQDCACVMIVSCALVKDFGAVVSYEGEPPEPFESLLESARSIAADAAHEDAQAHSGAEIAHAAARKPWWRFW